MTAQPLLSVDQALERVLEQTGTLPSEQVELKAAVGRFLAQEIVAGLDLPPFDNSAMDGFAVRAADTPGTLRKIGESAAGRPFSGSVGCGEAVMISTGAVIPDGADAVVMIEHVELVTSSRSEMTVTVPQAVRPHDCIRNAGSDVRAGERVLSAGTRIRPAQVGAAAALGLAELPCGRRPRAAVLPTGDELRRPGQQLDPGQIFNSNGPMLSALLRDAGAEVTEIEAVADTPQAHREALGAALEHDLVISSGGVSVGPHDIVRAAGAELGVQELFWRIRLKPGKPLSFGVRERGGGLGPALVFGLPGNPVSTLVCFELFVRPALSKLQGAADPRPSFRTAKLAQAITGNPERDEMVRVQLRPDGLLEPLRGQQSHQIMISSRADALVRIPAGYGELVAGSEVSYLSLGER